MQGAEVAGGDAQHEFDEIEPVHLLGHRVLHLQARVDLEEHRLGPVDVIDEFDRPGRPVGHGATELGAAPRQHVAHRFGEVRCGGLFDHFLVPPLERAVAVAQHDDVAAAVSDHLRLDVARPAHSPLHEDAVVAEIRPRQPHHPSEGFAQLVRTVARGDTDAATAARRFEHDRVADALGLLAGVVGPGEQARPGHERDAGRRRRGPGLVLDPEQLDLRRGGADEDEARRLDGTGEGGVLGQEAVARVHTPHVRGQGGLDDGVPA